MKKTLSTLCALALLGSFAVLPDARVQAQENAPNETVEKRRRFNSTIFR